MGAKARAPRGKDSPGRWWKYSAFLCQLPFWPGANGFFSQNWQCILLRASHISTFAMAELVRYIPRSAHLQNRQQCMGQIAAHDHAKTIHKQCRGHNQGLDRCGGTSKGSQLCSHTIPCTVPCLCQCLGISHSIQVLYDHRQIHAVG